MASEETLKELKRKQLLTQVLFESKNREISECDECGGCALREHMHIHFEIMGKRWTVCPDCDLPPKWHAKYSKRRGMRYYVYFDPIIGHDSRFVQWGHPTKGNPLNQSNCQNEYQEDTTPKRKRVDEDGVII